MASDYPQQFPQPAPSGAFEHPTEPPQQRQPDPLQPAQKKAGRGAAALAAIIVVLVVIAAGGLGYVASHPHGVAPSTASTGASDLASAPVGIVRNGPAELVDVSPTGHTTQTIDLKGSPEQMVTSSNGTEAYLLDSENAQVIPVDLTTGVAGTAIPVGKLPTDEELSPDGSTLYVTDNLSGTVIPINTQSLTARPAESVGQGIDGFIPSPTQPLAVVTFYGQNGQPSVIGLDDLSTGTLTPVTVGDNNLSQAIFSQDGSTIWVLEPGIGSADGEVIPIDVATHTTGSPITVGHQPSSEVISPNGSTMIVTNSGDQTVSVINLGNRSIAATIKVGSAPDESAFAPNSKTAWVACELSQTIVPITLNSETAGPAISVGNAPSAVAVSPSTGSIWTLFPSSNGSVSFLSAKNDLLPAIDVGNDPSVVVSTDGKQIWVANSLSNTVQRLDAAHNRVGPPIHVPLAPGDMVLSSDDADLYVLSFGTGSTPGAVTEISTASGTAGASLPVGISPSAIVLSPTAPVLYVTNFQSNSITVISTQSWTVTSTIKLPCSPDDLVITPNGDSLYADCSQSSAVVPVSAGGGVGTPISVGGDPEIVMGNLGASLYVQASSELQIISVATNRVVATQSETGNIVAIQPTPNGATLIALDNSGASVLLINGTTLKTEKSLSLGGQPEVLAVPPSATQIYVLDVAMQQMYVINASTLTLVTSLSSAPDAASIAVETTP